MEIIQITIAESDRVMSLQEFATYLRLFRAAYAVGTHFRNLSLREMLNEQETLVTSVRDVFSRGSLADPEHKFFNHPLGEDEIQLIEIKKESPMEILVGGSLVLLTFGVIISGGEIAFQNGKLRCKLPPLAVGIQKLRAVFGISAHSSRERLDAATTGLQSAVGIRLSVKQPETPAPQRRRAIQVEDI